MKRRLIPLLAAVLSGGALHAGFAPIPLDPSSFNADVVVEKDASPVLNARTTASVDGGTNNTGNTWYEMGYNRDAPVTGLPVAGSTFTHQSFADRSYTLASSYTAPNAILIDTQVTNATLTLTTPTAYGALSILGSSGNGGGNVTVVTLHQDGSRSTNVFNPSDWFGRANQAWTSNGRVTAPDFAFANVDAANPPTGNPRLNSSEFALANTTSPIVSISFYYTTGGSNVRNVIFAVSGGATTTGAFTPIPVTGYTYDVVVEADAPVRGRILDTQGAPATTQAMDTDVNNSNTWYERGLNQNNPPTIGTNAAFSGLPAPGTTIASTNGIYSFVMPPSYTAANNALYFNTASFPTNWTITPATPTAATVLSFLGGSGGGQANLAYTVHHQNGSTQTGVLPILDWHNAATPVFSSSGRVSTDTGVFNAVGSANPKLFAADIVLANTVSPVTSVDLAYTTPGPRPAIFAMSGSTTDELPFFVVQPAGVRNYSGNNASFGAVANGTGTVTYQWQKGTNGVYVDVANGGNITGATTTNLVITSFTAADGAAYRCVASNGAGSANSSAATLTVISTLTDVTAPGDPIAIAGVGTDNPPNEGIANAINDTMAKWLHRDANNAAPFVGPVGLTVTPSVGRTLVTGLRIYTANDADARDPIDYVFEGSNDGGATYSLISSNALALPTARNGTAGDATDPLARNLQQVLFPNTVGYSKYRLLFHNIRNNASGGLFQVGDIEFLGVVDNTPGLPAVAVASTLVHAINGSAAAFNGSAGGNPAPTLQWIKLGAGGGPLVDGGNISGATSESMSFATVTAVDEASYALVAMNSVGSVTSAPVVLKIFSDKVDITAGSTVTSFGGDSDAGLEGSFTIDDTYNPHENRGSGPNAGAGFPPFAGPVGLVVTPPDSTIVTGLRLYASDSETGRDPLDYKLEGSNNGGSSYTEISSGLVNLPLTRNPIANVVSPVNFDGLPNSVVEFLFSNGASYTSYRLTFSGIRDGGDEGNSRLRLGEIELLGVVGTAAPITISITKIDGGQVQLQWSAGSLLEANTATGPWTTNSAATSPLSVTPSGEQKFYQVIGQ